MRPAQLELSGHKPPPLSRHTGLAHQHSCVSKATHSHTHTNDWDTSAVTSAVWVDAGRAVTATHARHREP